MFGKTLERFVDHAPVCVMVRLAMERALGAEALDRLFRDTARRQYEKELLFSAVVGLMMPVVCGGRRSVHDAYQQSTGADRPAVSLASVYNKVNGVEPEVSAELVRHSARRVGPLVRLMRQDRPSPLPPYPVRIVDGNHLARTEHRLAVLRGTHVAALPGQALVVLDPAAGPGGPADPGGRAVRGRARPGAEPVRATVQVGAGGGAGGGAVGGRPQLLHHLDGVRPGGGGGVFPDPPARLHPALAGTDPVALARPLRHGAAVGAGGGGPGPAGRAAAVDPAGEGGPGRADRGRGRADPAADEPSGRRAGGGIGPAGGRRLPRPLDDRGGVPGTGGGVAGGDRHAGLPAGYPRAALFAFCVAAAAYNLVSLVKASLGAVHGREAVEQRVSGYHLSREWAAVYEGMAIAVGPQSWARFDGLDDRAFVGVLKQLAGVADLRRYRKARRGPKKKPPPWSPGKIKHLATAKLLSKRKTTKASP